MSVVTHPVLVFAVATSLTLVEPRASLASALAAVNSPHDVNENLAHAFEHLAFVCVFAERAHDIFHYRCSQGYEFYSFLVHGMSSANFM